jgi:hypothetical protein
MLYFVGFLGVFGMLCVGLLVLIETNEMNKIKKDRCENAK